MKKFLLLVVASLSFTAEAKIFLDYESDPLPLVKMNFLIPSSRAIASDTENLSLRFLSEFFDSGTEKLSRQKFQDALASYGASLEISTGPQYAEISVTFPLSGGKIPKGLVELIKDSWENPRINKDNFERSKKYLKANHLSTLDRDQSLLSIGVQKVVAIGLFGLSPYSTETFARIKLDQIAEMHKNFYSRDKDIWVGVIGPAELKKEVIQSIQTIFPKITAVEEGILKQQLATGHMPVMKGMLKPTFLVIDKKDLAQVHYGFVALAQQKTNEKTELVDNFSYHVLAGSGLESVYGKRIRGEKGLSYVVGALMSSYYEYPAVSLYANPQRNRQEEAFDVLDKLVNETFANGKILSNVKENMWSGWLLSYRNSERQSGATPEGRLERRKSIATGDLSYALYNKPIDDWNVKKSAAANRLGEIAKTSSILVAALGDSNEIEPYVKKYFPDYEILKVNYKEVINESWINQKKK